MNIDAIIAGATPGPWQTLYDRSGVVIKWRPRAALDAVTALLSED